MDVGQILTSLIGAGGTTGGVAFWFIKKSVTSLLEDLKGLSIKIDKVDEKYQAKICELENRCTALEAKK